MEAEQEPSVYDAGMFVYSPRGFLSEAYVR